MSASLHGFAVVRGRGYRPDQVDRKVARLTDERDAAGERAAELTGLAEELAAEADRLRSLVANMPPQDYEGLGRRAQQLLSLAESEAAELRSAAEGETQVWVDRADAEARRVRDAARVFSERVRADADSFAQRTLDAARAEADRLRGAAREESEETRRKAAESLQLMERRCAEVLAEQEKEQAAQSDVVDREIVEGSRDIEARIADLDAHGDKALGEHQRKLSEVQETARHRDEDAQARAQELLSEARMRAEAIERDTARMLREHEEQAEEMRQHMAHVRSSLAVLTGKTEDEAEAEAGVQGAP